MFFMQQNLDFNALKGAKQIILEYLAKNYTDTPFQTKDVARSIRAYDGSHRTITSYSKTIPILASDGWLQAAILKEAKHYKKQEYTLTKEVAGLIIEALGSTGSAGTPPATIDTEPTHPFKETDALLMHRFSWQKGS